MSQQPILKICLIGECLSQGGAERTMANLSRYFDTIGVEMHHVIVLDSIVYPHAGKVLNLGKLKNKTNGLCNKLKRFWVLFKFLRQQQFDYIIDFRIRNSFLQEYLISKILYNSPAIYTVHSAMTELYFPAAAWKARLIYAKNCKIVAVSKAIATIVKQKYGLSNVITIPNPIDNVHIAESQKAEIEIPKEYIIAAGGMHTKIKQFDKLMLAYKNSGIALNGIKLVLLGDGKYRKELEEYSKNLQISNDVIFCGSVINPFSYFTKAKFFVLSSRNEGLPTVLIESLACGIPVVSFDCVSGPNEIVVDGFNGLVVKDQNIEALSIAIERMATDKELHHHCSSNAASSVEKFSLPIIGEQWLNYFKNRTNK